MTEGGRIEGEAGEGGLPARRDALTRAFLFADLRGYTAFVEREGADAAAILLARYRRLVRSAVETFEGAEIRTEGDSFYVVFTSVSAAVRCGLAIVASAAADSSTSPDRAIHVGVGVHAGETVETDEGYVGSVVNIAARLCALAGPGEVFVSETVRDLTRAMGSVRYDSRGRRRLKGVAGPVAVFEAVDAATPVAASRRRRLIALAGLGALVLLGGAGAFLASRPAAGLPPGDWKIVSTMPLSGEEAPRGEMTGGGVKLAVDELNGAGGVAGRPISLEEIDHRLDDEGAAAIATGVVADPSAIALIGPWFSGLAYWMVPVTNEAGLLHCGPTTTHPELTKPSAGALEVRRTFPNRINFIRLAPADDIQAPAMAAFAYRDLDARVALLIDDGDIGRVIAEPFAEAYADLGGLPLRRTIVAGANPAPALDALDGSDPARVVFYAGISSADAAALRMAMVAAGHGDVPLLTWDAVVDGPGNVDGSFLQLAGDAGANTYAAHASVPPMKASFATRYRATFGREPDEYAAAAFACVELVSDALRAAVARGVGAPDLREFVRSHVVDPTRRHETVIGTIWFDANGDTNQQFVTFFRVDPTAADGTGDWVVFKQQDYGPPPP